MNATDMRMHLLPKKIIFIDNASRQVAPLEARHGGQMPKNSHARAIVEAAKASIGSLARLRTHGRDSTNPLAIEVSEEGAFFMVRLGTVPAYPLQRDGNYSLEYQIATFRAQADGGKLSVYLNSGETESTYVEYPIPELGDAIRYAFGAVPEIISRCRL